LYVFCAKKKKYSDSILLINLASQPVIWKRRSCSMGETVLLGRGRQITEISRHMWEEDLVHVPEHTKTRLGFMSEDHHLVRYFIVRELPHSGVPIQPEVIAQALQLSPARVNTVLDELEKNLFFLVRDDQGSVSWAYPVTAEITSHRLSFSMGEQLYGA
jgi:hypothetical protein